VAVYAAARCGTDTGSATVVARRMSDGTQLFSRPAIAASAGPEAYQSVSSIVVTRSGKAAWIASDHSIVSHHFQAQVLAGSSAGVRVLQTATNISRKSLRLRGSTVTWVAGGVKHSAGLG
jgi:hypothetical protein